MSVDDLVQAEMERQHLPGLSLAVVKRGNVVHVQGYGLADLELGVPATSDTVYQIGSLTKQFTATAIMLLVNAGKIDLDEPISSYLAKTPDAWRDVTVRHLLTHTAGIVRDGSPDYWSTPEAMQQDYSFDQMFEMIVQYPLDFAPGERCSYSNSGYFLLGLTIERITAKTYADFLAERIFTPLGMTVTRLNDHRAVIANRASGYLWTERGWQHPDYIGLNHHFANGGLLSSVTDLAKWDAALYTDAILPQARLQQMWTPVTLTDGSTTEHGFGWVITTHEGHKLLAHGGAIPGFTAYIARFVDEALTVIVLTNLYMAAPGTIARSVADSYLSA